MPTAYKPLENKAISHRKLVLSLVQQIPCASLCLLLPEGGRMAQICVAAMLGFWAGVVLLMARRPLSPARRDIAFIRWGFLPLFVATVLAAAWAVPAFYEAADVKPE